MNNTVERIFESVAGSLHTPVVRVTCVLLVGGGSAFADERASIAVHPPTIRLGTSARQTRVVATLTDRSGRERDTTGSVELSIDDESVAQISEGRVVAVANGETTLRARVEELTTSAQVRVGNLEKRPRASFRRVRCLMFIRIWLATITTHRGRQGHPRGRSRPTGTLLPMEKPPLRAWECGWMTSFWACSRCSHIRTNCFIEH